MKEIVHICEECAKSTGSSEGLRKLALTVKALLGGAIIRLERPTNVLRAAIGGEEKAGSPGGLSPRIRRSATTDAFDALRMSHANVLNQVNEKYRKILATRKANEERWRTMAEGLSAELKDYRLKLEQSKSTLKKEKRSHMSTSRERDSLNARFRDTKLKYSNLQEVAEGLKKDLKQREQSLAKLKLKLKRVEADAKAVENAYEAEKEKFMKRLENAKRKYAEVKAAASRIAESYKKVCEVMETRVAPSWTVT
eukprot:CAMPEP_0170176126 /NCGR_PEP_ID=MMETSP0040_2-20121228/9073_1 /TAXON_ID=641309 /ORGANISM="Lotharella oceanica, Strain CCMP622" /LENGTH=252 /DNA_ID=CAMNT_0010418351 /DNA_START=26 /DNA_END=784 /DNA_ORIENTATION=+